MIRRKDGYTRLTVVLVILMLTTAVLPAAVAKSNIKEGVKGFDKGVSWANVVPLKKVTFVNFDKDSYLDDYAYLAAVPTTVFYDKTSGRLFSYPLLYYEDPYPVEDDKERSLNARQGIDYFMEDWMSYCNGKLDGMTLINVPESKVEQWSSRNITTIKGSDPYSIASKIALHDWSYSDYAVVAVIDESFKKPMNKIEDTIDGTFSFRDVKTLSFEIPKTNHIDPQYKEFDVPEGYKLIKVRSWYPCFYFGISPPIPGFENLINMTIPPGDRDLQLYCNYNGDWMETKMTISWNAKAGMDRDKTETYVYKSGKWRLGVTDTPTKSPLSVISNLKPSKKIGETSAEPQVHRSLLGMLNFGRYGSIF
ncbi:MAG TPA: hypothetical protein ENI45_03985, partial [Thermoplasmatales archaeon]|nr:hypothetical protein [Thermoplasmatales archaeon]